jgi:hypothetical protein
MKIRDVVYIVLVVVAIVVLANGLHEIAEAIYVVGGVL